MGGRTQTDQETAAGHLQQQPGDHSPPRKGKPGRRPREKVVPPLGDALLQTVRHFLPPLYSWIDGLPDPRNPDAITYSPRTLVWSGVLIPLLGLRSRRQFRFESNAPDFVHNLNAATGDNNKTAPHDDTLTYFLKRVAPEHFHELRVQAIRWLTRGKVLDHGRLFGRFLIAIDATGQLTFRHRHCPHCLTRKCSRTGKVLYFHNILEAKLVTKSGLAFSIGTQFIENMDTNATKQDCEHKAFHRLAEQLKSDFPQLPMTILGDALYDCEPVKRVCKRNDWRYILVTKEGSRPAFWAEYITQRELCEENRAYKSCDGGGQRFAWVNGVEYGDNVLECWETDRQGNETHFAWTTDIKIREDNVSQLANQGGRVRWKIENQGFNTQKNHGYELEHAYSEHEQANKNFYLLMQLAHMLNQLIIHGLLRHDFKETLGSIRNYLRRLAESLRNVPISPEIASFEKTHRIQIRLDSS